MSWPKIILEFSFLLNQLKNWLINWLKRIYNPTNWRKHDQLLFRAAGGKLGKPKHGFKVHLFGGISRKGFTPLIAFRGKMCSGEYNNCMRLKCQALFNKNFHIDIVFLDHQNSLLEVILEFFLMLRYVTLNNVRYVK